MSDLTDRLNADDRVPSAVVTNIVDKVEMKEKLTHTWLAERA